MFCRGQGYLAKRIKIEILFVLFHPNIHSHDIMPNLSLYSPYYAEACNELGGAHPRHNAKTTQLLA